MSARDIILDTIPGCTRGNVQALLLRLETEGYRLLKPGELDPATIKQCARVAERVTAKAAAENGSTKTPTGRTKLYVGRIIAKAIRSLSTPTEGE